MVETRSTARPTRAAQKSAGSWRNRSTVTTTRSPKRRAPTICATGWPYTGIGRTPESPVTVAQSITHDSRTNRKTSEAVFVVGNGVGAVVRQMRYQARKIAAGTRNTHALVHRLGAGERRTTTAAAAVSATPVGCDATATHRSPV